MAIAADCPAFPFSRSTVTHAGELRDPQAGEPVRSRGQGREGIPRNRRLLPDVQEPSGAHTAPA